MSSHLYRSYETAVRVVMRTGLQRRLGDRGRSVVDAIDATIRKFSQRQRVASYRVNGLTIAVPPDGYFGTELTDGTYEPATTQILLQHLQPGMVMVDVGAHIGHYTVAAAQRVGPHGRVIAFEPDPVSFSYLAQNVAANGLSERVTMQNVAVSGQTGTANLYLGRRDRVANSLIRSDATMPRSVVCDTIALDHYFQDDPDPRVDMVKMDIEGGEYDALRGMVRLLAANPHLKLLVEFHPVNLQRAAIDADEFIALLHELAFTKFSMIYDGLIPLGNPIDMPRLMDAAGSSFVNLLCEKGDP
jgi:FkbM family methyltransferase